ncbi:MAG: methionyl-tRNA formyltransferase [Chloroflexi bacterium]|nr:MAG: methionyl-tRNA formyltransferase [Chloroflexota bacterium]MBA4375846.1 methionyl-tRNA formyltransferase [Anaerolinea sp.]
MKLNIVFLGSPDFAVAILKMLASKFIITGVVTQPDRPAGRGKILTPPPVKALAEELGIPTMQPERLKNPDSFSQLQAWKPDLIVVAAFGQILRQNVLDLPKYGCINVHASYLPRWRGAAPIQAAILNGDPFSGVSIMKMDAGIDTGAVLSQEKVTLAEDETLSSLTQKLADAGSKLLVDTLPPYLEGTLKPKDQENKNATYAPMLKKEDGRLDFTQSSVAIDRKVRALNDWPGTFTEVKSQILKIRKVKSIDSQHHKAGLRCIVEKYPAIGTPDGLIVLLEVQPTGKKWMSGADYLRGIQNWISDD